MMKEPWFWRATSPAARALSLSLTPLSALYDVGRRLRIAATKPARPPIPVVCIGNASVGGVGKTPFALMLAPLLAARGFKPAFVSRGYGGALADPCRVDPSVHSASQVGDEPLLLAEKAPAFIGRDRGAAVRLAASAGADIVIMDDGFQNPAVQKTFSILLENSGDATGRLLPAGPLREPLEEAYARADAIAFVLAPGDSLGVTATGSPHALFLNASLQSQQRGARARVVAFCGIGGPARFHETLWRAGYDVVATRDFPDHHPYSKSDLSALRALAGKSGARLITTTKDFVRLPKDFRAEVLVLPVEMRIDDPGRLVSLIADAAARFHAETRDA